MLSFNIATTKEEAQKQMEQIEEMKGREEYLFEEELPQQQQQFGFQPNAEEERNVYDPHQIHISNEKENENEIENHVEQDPTQGTNMK